MPSLSLWLLITASSIRVTGADSCPSPDAILKHLAALAGDKGPAVWSATTHSTPAGLQILLVERDGTVVSQRVIPISPNRSCDDLADIVALVLASWLSNLSSQALGAEPLPSLSTPPAPPARPSRQPWSLELGLAPAGSLTGGGLAPGGILQFEAGPARARWALRLVGVYDGPRQAPEGPGAVSWQRFQGGVGASYELLRSPCSLELGGDAVLSDILLRGVRFPIVSSSTSLDPGGEVSVRLALLRGQWHPWIGAWATVWTRQEVPSVQGLALRSALPQAEVFAGLGLSWRSVERF